MKKRQKKERGSPSWETKQKVCVEQKEMRKGRKLRLIYSGPQMPTKESGLSSEEMMPRKNSNPQTQTNSSEARKSPGNVNVCAVGVGGSQTQGVMRKGTGTPEIHCGQVISLF